MYLPPDSVPCGFQGLREDSWSELDDLGKQILEAGRNSGVIGGDTQHLAHMRTTGTTLNPLSLPGLGRPRDSTFPRYSEQSPSSEPVENYLMHNGTSFFPSFPGPQILAQHTGSGRGASQANTAGGGAKETSDIRRSIRDRGAMTRSERILVRGHLLIIPACSERDLRPLV